FIRVTGSPTRTRSQIAISHISTLSLHDALPISQGAVFRAKTKHAVITAYNSGKVLFQGKKPQAEVEKWTDATIESENVNKPSHRSEEHTSELQSRFDLVCRLLLEKKKKREERS